MPSMRANPANIYAYVIQRYGFSEAAAIGLIANIKAESNFYTDAVGDNGTSGGLFQHHKGRWQNLVAFAKRQGRDWREWQVQVDFAMSEPDARGAPLSTSDPGVFAQWWSLNFERPAGGKKSAVARANIAYAYWGEGLPEVSAQGVEQAFAQAPAASQQPAKGETYTQQMWSTAIGYLSQMIRGRARSGMAMPEPGGEATAPDEGADLLPSPTPGPGLSGFVPRLYMTDLISLPSEPEDIAAAYVPETRRRPAGRERIE